jgi:hypothetical protein
MGRPPCAAARRGSLLWVNINNAATRSIKCASYDQRSAQVCSRRRVLLGTRQNGGGPLTWRLCRPLDSIINEPPYNSGAGQSLCCTAWYGGIWLVSLANGAFWHMTRRYGYRDMLYVSAYVCGGTLVWRGTMAVWTTGKLRTCLP